MGDKSSTENREVISSPETEVAGMKTEKADFIVTAFPTWVVFLFSQNLNSMGLLRVNE